jgi:hypothetical protein
MSADSQNCEVSRDSRYWGKALKIRPLLGNGIWKLFRKPQWRDWNVTLAAQDRGNLIERRTALARQINIVRCISDYKWGSGC